jgi:hypothetical protein
MNLQPTPGPGDYGQELKRNYSGSFSRSKRFEDKKERTPGPGEYRVKEVREKGIVIDRVGASIDTEMNNFKSKIT